MKIAESVVLVTGGASGLGASCARRFCRLGARVLIGDLNETAGNALAAELGETAAFSTLDVTRSEQISEVLEGIAQTGPLRAVVNCAGVIAGQRIVGRRGAHDLETFSRVVQVNLIGTFNVLRLAAERMATLPPEDDGERGVVINTASIAAYEGQIGQAAYAASKGGVASLTLPAARELARHGIRVCAIAPGIFQTPMMEQVTDKIRSSLESQIPYPPRFGEPDEFAALAQHIVENRMINGTVLRIDGAARMQPS